MNIFKNVLLAVLAGVAIGASAIAWREYEELIPLRAATLMPSERITLQQRAVLAEAHVQELREQVATARTAAAASADAAAATATTPIATGSSGVTVVNAAPGATTAAAAAAAQNKKAELTLALLNNPDALRLLADMDRKQVQKDYGPLLKGLNLSPELKAQLQELLVQRQAAFVDVAGAALSQGLKPNPNSPMVRDLVAAAQGGVDSRIQALVGPDAYAKYQNYQNTLMLRDTAAGIAGDLNKSSAPLTPAQRAQLTNSFVNTAQKVLTPTQLQALNQAQQIQSNREQLDRINDIVKQAQKPAPAPGVVTTPAKVKTGKTPGG